MSTPPSSDDALIALALDVATEHRGRSIRDEIPGVTEHDISRWNANRLEGKANSLTTAKRKALLAYQRSLTATGSGGAGDVASVSRLDVILEDLLAAAVGADTWVQLEILREIAALKRADAGQHDSRAAELRAEERLIEARTYEARSKAMAADADSSRTRHLIDQAVRTGVVPAELFRDPTSPAGSPAGSS